MSLKAVLDFLIHIYILYVQLKIRGLKICQMYSFKLASKNADLLLKVQYFMSTCCFAWAWKFVSIINGKL